MRLRRFASGIYFYLSILDSYRSKIYQILCFTYIVISIVPWHDRDTSDYRTTSLTAL